MMATHNVRTVSRVDQHLIVGVSVTAHFAADLIESDSDFVGRTRFSLARHISIIHTGHPREQSHPTISKHTMQKQLTGLVFAVQLWRFKLSNFGQTISSIK